MQRFNMEWFEPNDTDQGEHMVPSVTGEWVRHADVVELEARCAELQKYRDTVEGAVEYLRGDNYFVVNKPAREAGVEVSFELDNGDDRTCHVGPDLATAIINAQPKATP